MPTFGEGAPQLRMKIQLPNSRSMTARKLIIILRLIAYRQRRFTYKPVTFFILNKVMIKEHICWLVGWSIGWLVNWLVGNTYALEPVGESYGHISGPLFLAFICMLFFFSIF